MKITDINELKKISKEIRKSIVTQVYKAQSGHPGGSLSIADILTVLYFNEMNIDEKNPKMGNRDRLVLSKGHCSPALYAVLGEKGFFNKNELETALGYINDIDRDSIDYDAINKTVNQNTKTNIEVTLSNAENGYMTVTLSRKIDIITPGLNLILSSPYKVSTSRVIKYE